jgi:hypothetical protein
MRSRKSSTEPGGAATVPHPSVDPTVEGEVTPAAPTGRRVDYGIAAALAVAAAAIRAPGIGRWGFTTDEFYLYQSVSNILETGLPRFPSGGYYVRGIALQYLSAIPALALDEKELAIRLIPLVFGILTVPLFYFLCRRNMPLSYAVPCALLLLLSSWHIEFSRFGRFYTPFQFVFLAFVLAFTAVYWNGAGKHRSVPWILALISPFLYEGSIFLPLILLLVLLREERPVRKEALRLVASVPLLLAVNYLVNGIGFRSLGVIDPLPPDMVMQKAGFLDSLPVVLPTTVLLRDVFTSVLPAMGYSAMVAAAAFVLSRRECREGDGWTKTAHTLIVVLPLFHLYALLAFLLAILAANRDRLVRACLRSARYWVPYISLTVIFWLAVIAATGHGSRVLHILVGYPPLKKAVLAPFASAAPMWGLCLLGAVAASTIRNAFGRDRRSAPLLSILLLCLLLIPVFRTPYSLTRYSFFLFPLALLLGSMEVRALACWIERRSHRSFAGRSARGLALLPLAVFLVAEDFHYEQIRDVSAPEINFRIGKYAPFEFHWQERADHREPALYLNRAYRDGDRIVIDSITFSHYLANPFSFYSPRTAPWYRPYARDSGSREVWTGHPMIDDLADVAAMAPDNPERSLWLISKEKIGDGTVHEIAKRYGLEISLRSVGLDRRFKVWELRRNGGKSGPGYPDATPFGSGGRLHEAGNRGSAG